MKASLERGNVTPIPVPLSLKHWIHRHRGRQVDGVWVFGGIERGTNKWGFFEVVSDRSADTLIPIIKRWVLPGTNNSQ